MRIRKGERFQDYLFLLTCFEEFEEGVLISVTNLASMCHAPPSIGQKGWSIITLLPLGRMMSKG
jgi:hypothetical protein